MPQIAKFKNTPAKVQQDNPEEQRRRADVAFVAIVTLAYLFLAANYSRLVPLATKVATYFATVQSNPIITNPDEAAHVANALEYKTGHLPVFTQGSPNFEAHQPPLYYWLISPIVNAGSADDGVGIARWVSILLGALTIWSAFACIRTLFPENTSLVRGVPAFVGLLPMYISLCASISNDVLINLIVVLALWKTARVIKIATTRPGKSLNKPAIWVGGLLGLALLTKTTGLVLVPTILAMVWMLQQKKIIDTRQALSVAAISIGLGVLIVSPWWIRNTILYGDPLAQHIFTTAFQNTATTRDMLQIWSPLKYLSTVAIWSFDSFWGVFNSMRLFLPPGIYICLAITSAVSLIGLFRWRKRALIELSVGQSIFLSTLGALLAFTFLAFLRFNTAFFQAQGRYLFTALVPIATFFVIGIAQMLPGKLRNSGATEIAVDSLLLLLNLISLQHIADFVSTGGTH